MDTVLIDECINVQEHILLELKKNQRKINQLTGLRTRSSAAVNDSLSQMSAQVAREVVQANSLYEAMMDIFELSIRCEQKIMG